MIKDILKQVQQGKLTVADAAKEFATSEALGIA
ncbi:1-(5-phosphoribosyl)-5-amino-4-imidazole-carboxylate carboxylase, partial [Priestia megaterium]